MAGLSKRLGRSLEAEGELVARWPGLGIVAALAYAAMLATFPDEGIDLLGSAGWARAIQHYAPIGEDLIDDVKLAHIVEENESSTGAQR